MSFRQRRPAQHPLRTATVLVLTLFLLFYAAPVCIANPLVFFSGWTDLATLGIVFLIVPFLLTVAIETAVAWAVIRHPEVSWRRMLALVSLVNLITFLPTQLVWLHAVWPSGTQLAGSRLVWSIALLEAGVVITEFLLLRYGFGRLRRRGVFGKPVTNARLSWAALAANAASFLLGFIVPILSFSRALPEWSF